MQGVSNIRTSGTTKRKGNKDSKRNKGSVTQGKDPKPRGKNRRSPYKPSSKKRQVSKGEIGKSPGPEKPDRKGKGEMGASAEELKLEPPASRQRDQSPPPEPKEILQAEPADAAEVEPKVDNEFKFEAPKAADALHRLDNDRIACEFYIEGMRDLTNASKLIYELLERLSENPEAAEILLNGAATSLAQDPKYNTAISQGLSAAKKSRFEAGYLSMLRYMCQKTKHRHLAIRFLEEIVEMELIDPDETVQKFQQSIKEDVIRTIKNVENLLTDGWGNVIKSSGREVPYLPAFHLLFSYYHSGMDLRQRDRGMKDEERIKMAYAHLDKGMKYGCMYCYSEFASRLRIDEELSIIPKEMIGEGGVTAKRRECYEKAAKHKGATDELIGRYGAYLYVSYDELNTKQEEAYTKEMQKYLKEGAEAPQPYKRACYYYGLYLMDPEFTKTDEEALKSMEKALGLILEGGSIKGLRKRPEFLVASCLDLSRQDENINSSKINIGVIKGSLRRIFALYAAELMRKRATFGTELSLRAASIYYNMSKLAQQADKK